MTQPMAAKFDVLCGKCSRLFNEPWESEYTQNLAGLKMDFFKTPHHTIASLQNAAAQGCHICSLFCDKESVGHEGSLPSEDERLTAEMTRSRIDEEDQNWSLEVRAGQYSFGQLKLLPLDGWWSLGLVNSSSFFLT
jgi:hypothetical protein